MEKSYKYDAFISYRHIVPDMKVAEKLQNLLESFVPPRRREERKDFKKFRIFRDVTELPVNGDLSSAITDALEESRFLIVVCSEKTKESKWCLQEIEYFKKLHDGNNNQILTIVADGLPEKAFPDLLRYEEKRITDENGNESVESVEIEPLAANVASDSLHETMKKLNTEYLKIAAPLLGCDFDDLYARALRQKTKKRFTFVSVAAAILLAFSIVSTASLLTINSQRRSLLHEKAGFLASEAGNYIRDDKIYEAEKSAYESLKIDVTPDGLSRAIQLTGLFDRNGFVADGAFEGSAQIDEAILLEGGKRLVITDKTDKLTLWDTDTLEKIGDYPGGSLNYFVFKDRKIGKAEVPAFRSGAHLSGDERTINLTHEKVIAPEESQSPDMLFIADNKTVKRINLSDGGEIWEYECPAYVEIKYAEGDFVLVSFDEVIDYENTRIYLALDAETGEEIKRIIPPKNDFFLPDVSLTDGKLVITNFSFSEGKILVYDENNLSEELFSEEIPGHIDGEDVFVSGDTLVAAYLVDKEASLTEGEMIVKAYNLRSGREISSYKFDVGASTWSSDTSCRSWYFVSPSEENGSQKDILVFARYDHILYLDMKDYSVLKDYKAPSNIEYAYYSSNGLIFAGIESGKEVVKTVKSFKSENNYLYSSEFFPVKFDIADYSNNTYVFVSEADSKAYIYRRYDNENALKIGEGLETGYSNFTWNNEKTKAAYIRVENEINMLFVYDTEKKSEEKVAESASYLSLVSFCGNYACVRNYDKGYEFYDITSGEIVGESEDCDEICSVTGQLFTDDYNTKTLAVITPGSEDFVIDYNNTDDTNIEEISVNHSDISAGFEKILADMTVYDKSYSSCEELRIYKTGSQDYLLLDRSVFAENERPKLFFWNKDASGIFIFTNENNCFFFDTETGAAKPVETGEAEESEISSFTDRYYVTDETGKTIYFKCADNADRIYALDEEHGLYFYDHQAQIADYIWFEDALYIVDGTKNLVKVNVASGEAEIIPLESDEAVKFDVTVSLSLTRIGDRLLVSLDDELWCIEGESGKTIFRFYDFCGLDAENKLYRNSKGMYAYPLYSDEEIIDSLAGLKANS